MIRPPHDTEREKNICSAAFLHTCTLRISFQRGTNRNFIPCEHYKKKKKLEFLWVDRLVIFVKVIKVVFSSLSCTKAKARYANFFMMGRIIHVSK